MTEVLAHGWMTLGTSTPRLGVDWSDRPARYLTIDGTSAYHLGYSCGTCGLVLRRQPGGPAGPLSAEAVRDRLNTGLVDLDPDVIAAFSAQLPYGPYLVMLLDVRPMLVTPGSADDYFAVEGPDAWRGQACAYSIDPANVAYYRLGDKRVDEQEQLFQFAVPITDPTQADPARTAHYTAATGHPTAVAMGLLDIEGPWFSRTRHWGLFHYFLDGHHKTAAANGGSVRLLTFIAAGESIASEEEIRRLPELLQAEE